LTDDIVAIRALERDTAAGSIVAQSVLGSAVVWGGELFGEKFEPNYARALTCLQRAADPGPSRAIYHLGVLYEDGLGVAGDIDQDPDTDAEIAEANPLHETTLQKTALSCA
jgi:TPR repeat protein